MWLYSHAPNLAGILITPLTMAGFRMGLVGALLVLSPAAWAFCRVVVGDGIPPVVTPAQSVLFATRHDPGGGCRDAGELPDADTADGGDDGGLDDDAGVCVPPRDLVSMVVQPKFELQQSGTRFALLMVTPGVPRVDAGPRHLFQDLAVQTAPLVDLQTKYVEDASLGYQCEDGGGCGPDLSGNSSAGCGADYGSNGSTTWTPPSNPPGADADAGLPTEPQIVGSYEVAVLAGADMTAIAAWLTDHSYRYSSTDLDALAAYVDIGWTVTAVQVHGGQPVSDGALEPLGFTWEGTEIRLPMGVSYQPGGGTAPITVYIQSNGRFDLPGAHVSYAQFEPGAFLTRNDLEANFGAPASADPIARRVSGDPTTHDHMTVTQTIRIPSSDCPSSGCGCRLAGQARSLSGPALLAAIALLLRRRRRK